ncbi:MAG TPA: hypothetical protein VG389_11470 [Myxococcota bacterium]|nr:hypothetical protein [Myxococcota bacterium]
MRGTRWGVAALALALAATGACARPENDGRDGGDITFDSGAKPPLCGNGLVETGEECEPPGTATCDVTCQIIPPPPPMCGNGVLEPGEACDPPNMTTCAPDCTLINVGSASVGDPCAFDSECMGGPPGTTARCIDETNFGWPGGYCLIQDCTIDTTVTPATDDCPSGSTCRGLGDGMGGVTYYCLASCTPSPTGNGGCRGDTTTDFSYACTPDIVTPTEGYCFRGCETDVGCNLCDAGTGTCFNDGLACATNADCAQIDQCVTAINTCVPGHAGAPGAQIGDPCLADADCPQYAYCATDPTTYPGGYCIQLYCGSYPTLPEFQCGPGGTCPALSGFFGGVLNLCAGSCLVDTANPNSTCDTDRGDMNDYECMEVGVPAMITSLNDIFDNDGAAGLCFQCEALFGATAGCP